MRRGSKASAETRLKQSLARRGISPPNKGIPHTEEAKRKMSLARKGKSYHSVKQIEDLRKRMVGNKLSLGRSGAKHPNWKGGITPLARRLRNHFRMRQWRSDIFTRDEFTCVICGAKSGDGKAVYLEAHHYPKKFADILQEYRITSIEVALNCEQLWDINNGQTLCKSCHDKTKK